MYRQHIHSIPPIHRDHWSFAIIGGVRHPLILSYDDLLSFPTETLRCAIACAGKSVDRPLLGEAVWRGVPLYSLLDQLDIASEMRFACIHAADGYTTVLPLDRLAKSYLVYEMDGQPLSPEYGYPARLIAPGLFGYKMLKWIERIELSDSSAGGFWESRGYSLEGDAATRVAILSYDQSASGVITLTGVVYGGSSPVRAVWLSIDSGDRMPVPFVQDSLFALAHWHIDWTPPGAGDYHLRADASSASSSDQHTLVIRVR